MKSRDLNKLLIAKFPQLEKKYKDEVDWQEGDDTGSHTVYGDVFTPYLKDCIEENKKEEIIYAFDYIETLLDMKDAYVDEVIAFSVLESICYLASEKNNLFDLFGPKSQEVIKDFL